MTKSRGLRDHHGMAATPTYAIWQSMRARCERPSNHAYADYGGRGITVCDAWHKFRGFYSDMGEAPHGQSLERIDNSKGYGPDNCRWATAREQGRNKRNNVLITIEGETLPLCDWAERAGLRYATIHQRIRKGWPPALAVTTPLVTVRKGVPRGQRIAVWGAENGVVWSDPQVVAERRAA